MAVSHPAPWTIIGSVPDLELSITDTIVNPASSSSLATRLVIGQSVMLRWNGRSLSTSTISAGTRSRKSTRPDQSIARRRRPALEGPDADARVISSWNRLPTLLSRWSVVVAGRSSISAAHDRMPGRPCSARSVERAMQQPPVTSRVPPCGVDRALQAVGMDSSGEVEEHCAPERSRRMPFDDREVAVGEQRGGVHRAERDWRSACRARSVITSAPVGCESGCWSPSGRLLTRCERARSPGRTSSTAAIDQACHGSVPTRPTEHLTA